MNNKTNFVICPQCHTKLDSDVQYCFNCGTQLNPNPPILPLSASSLEFLRNYTQRFASLTWEEFEDMVAVYFRHKGWDQVQVTARIQDEGVDVIGFFNNRRQYVEVKYHESNIGRPIVQKFHSKLMMDHIQEGWIVAKADFTQEAYEYAQRIAAQGQIIHFLTGTDLLKDCETLLKGGISSDKLCAAIDLNNQNQTVQNAFNNRFFSYPRQAIQLVLNTKEFPYHFVPYRIITYSVIQHFTNSTGSMHWDLNKPKAHLLLQENRLMKPIPLSTKMTSVAFMQKEMERQQKSVQILKQLVAAEPNPHQLKHLIQQLETKNVQYIGQNNHQYTKTCKPNLSNIHLLSSQIYWQLQGKIEYYLNGATFQTQITDHTLTYLFNNSLITSRTPHILCTECHQPIKGDLYEHLCHSCGKVVCNQCSHSKRRFLFRKDRWCKSCGTETDHPSRNVMNLRSAKETYLLWYQDIYTQTISKTYTKSSFPIDLIPLMIMALAFGLTIVIPDGFINSFFYRLWITAFLFSLLFYLYWIGKTIFRILRNKQIIISQPFVLERGWRKYRYYFPFLGAFGLFLISVNIMDGISDSSIFPYINRAIILMTILYYCGLFVIYLRFLRNHKSKKYI